MVLILVAIITGFVENLFEIIGNTITTSVVGEPSEVLKEVQENPVDILITGECFYYTDLDSFSDFIAAMHTGNIGNMLDNVQPKSIDSGSEL